MTKILLQQIQIEYEQTDQTIEDLCSKYSCSKKDLKGYTKWEKTPQNSASSCIKLIYDALYTPKSDAEWIVEPVNKPDVTKYLEMEPEEIEAEIVTTAEELKNKKPVTKDSLPIQARDGFEGLRLLDTKMQTQALSLLNAIDDMLHNIETAKDVRDLVASQTAIRDSYFNTKAP